MEQKSFTVHFASKKVGVRTNFNEFVESSVRSRSPESYILRVARLVSGAHHKSRDCLDESNIVSDI